ncbi:GTPase HflX [Desulfurococcus mucosus]|uniref:GTPase HflX n=1 Tax=Desulfurococcus mucosus (strain ATCC 35584 / DSM 2162 / JCM 9187 / O7/1) TaxID=765177 RepID=E8R792_DESM0|nr:GTPase HflX [Desulfurococcus mucosus]ADV65557.1 GTP-binding proten HflX [Desulfurococcus mucosus DSM 2162]
MRVAVAVPRRYWGFLEEELGLVKTIYSDIQCVVKVGKPSPGTYLSSERLRELGECGFEKLVVMDRLKPVQVVNLARELKRDVVDRVMLILEIFAEHAGSKEAKMQIELARLKYYIPLVREAVRYAKMGELHGFLGAGRYGYEKYYLMLKRKEARVRRELEELRRIRGVRRKQRIESGLPHVAITGYTCAGKTSLFNALTGLGKPVGPEPFTTLAPKSSRVAYRDVCFILTDTVGFIRDLPPEIIEAFYATLEEISSADVLVNVVDASKPLERIRVELETTRGVFSKIGVHGKPVIVALNKVDLLGDYTAKVRDVEGLLAGNEELIPVSSTMRFNLELLMEALYRVLRGGTA